MLGQFSLGLRVHLGLGREEVVRQKLLSLALLEDVRCQVYVFQLIQWLVSDGIGVGAGLLGRLFAGQLSLCKIEVVDLLQKRVAFLHGFDFAVQG